MSNWFKDISSLYNSFRHTHSKEDTLGNVFSKISELGNINLEKFQGDGKNVVMEFIKNIGESIGIGAGVSKFAALTGIASSEFSIPVALITATLELARQVYSGTDPASRFAVGDWIYVDVGSVKETAVMHTEMEEMFQDGTLDLGFDVPVYHVCLIEGISTDFIECFDLHDGSSPLVNRKDARLIADQTAFDGDKYLGALKKIYMREETPDVLKQKINLDTGNSVTYDGDLWTIVSNVLGNVEIIRDGITRVTNAKSLGPGFADNNLAHINGIEGMTHQSFYKTLSIGDFVWYSPSNGDNILHCVEYVKGTDIWVRSTLTGDTFATNYYNLYKISPAYLETLSNVKEFRFFKLATVEHSYSRPLTSMIHQCIIKGVLPVDKFVNQAKSEPTSPTDSFVVGQDIRNRTEPRKPDVFSVSIFAGIVAGVLILGYVL